MTRRAWLLIPALVLMLLAYLPAWRAVFIWDDSRYVTQFENHKSWEGLRNIWFRPRTNPDPYPVVLTALWIQHRFFGDNPAGYHATNVAVHLINCALIWLLFRRLGFRAAGTAALLFGLHPMRVESVYHVSELKDLLSTLFYVLSALSWLAHLSGKGRTARAGSLACFVAAMLSKTVACTLPVLLTLHLLVIRPPGWKRLAPALSVYYLIAIAGGLNSIWWERNVTGAAESIIHHAMGDRVLIAGRALWFYAGKALWPVNQATIYPKWDLDSGANFVFPCLAVLILAACSWLALRGRRFPLAACAAYTIILFPALGFFDFSSMHYSYVADHYQYFAGAALVVILATVGDFTQRPWVGAFRLFALPQWFLILAALVLATMKLGETYRSEEVFWRHNISKNPGSADARFNLGIIHRTQGETDKALEEFIATLQADPDYLTAHLMVGDIWMERGDRDRARESYAAAAAIEPRTIRQGEHRALAWSNLGDLAITAKDWPGAISAYTESLRILPGSSVPRLRLSLALGSGGDFAQALEEAQKVVAAEPENARALFLEANALWRLGRGDEARNSLERSLTLAPDDPAARKLLDEMKASTAPK